MVMKRILAGLLAMIIAVAGIEPVAVRAAEKEENVFDVGNHEELEMVENMLVGADFFDTKSYEVTKGSVTVLDEEEDIAPPMQRASTIASGTCGSNASWTLDSEYTLTISGSGTMADYSHYNEQPWYSYASNIKSIVVNNGITRIGSYAFANFQNVNNIAYYNTVTEIGSFAFAFTFPGLDGTFSIGANVEVIEPYAFSGNIETSYTVNSGNKYYCAEGGNLYDINKTGLVQAGTLTSTSISLPSTVELIWYGAMVGGAYTSFDNSNIQLVYPDACFGCVDLKTVKLNSVVELGAAAFAGCESLQSFTVPSSTTGIYSQVFMECTNLSSITFKGNAPTFGDDVFYNVVATANYDSSKSGWTSSVRQNYGGTITWKDVNQGSTQSNTIRASNITKTVSSSSRTFSLGASAKDNASLSYSSNNSSISVNSSGNCTISANYIGSATITIKAAATSNYKETTKTITVTVNPVKAEIISLTKSGTSATLKVNDDIGNVQYDIRWSTNSDFTESKYSYCNDYNSAGYKLSDLTSGKTYYFQVRGTKLVDGSWYDGAWSESKNITIGKKKQTITAKNISKTVSSSERKIAINATTNGNGKLTYKSGNSKIKVKSGKVIIPKNFIGKATITITAAGTSTYQKATKKITVTVKPVKATINSVKNNKKGVITIKLKKNIGSVKYEIQVADNSDFSNKKTFKKSYNSNGYTLSNLTKGKTYYVRVRGYKTVNDVKYNGKWSDVKKIKISK